MRVPLRPPTAWAAPEGERDQAATQRRTATVARLFGDAGVSFPPALVFLRAFKRERELEVWASGERDAPLRLITRYGVCAASGGLGPKRREGDLQVPEGFYRVGRFNAKSRFHLSMWVSYPNASDRVLGDPAELGGQIMIHGGCASIGCLAMSDQRIEELWVIARSAPRPIEVHIFPAREPGALRGDEGRRAFWANLAEGKRLFDRDRRLPRVRVRPDGRYAFRPR